MRSLLLAAALAACGGDAPSCQAAFDKLTTALDMPHAQMGAAVSACEQAGYAADTRRCIARSTSLDELERCVAHEPGFDRTKRAR